MKKQLAIFAFALIMLAGCIKKQIPVDPGVAGLDYYPLKKGHYVIYDIDSTIYTELPRDTFEYHYQVKEKLTETFNDNEGKEAWRLERYIRRSDTLPWFVKEVWMVSADNKKVQVQQGNIRYTKLAFPVSDDQSWNGNAQNTLGERTYTYDYFDRAEEINGIKFEKVLRVRQLEYPTLISYQSFSEKYAAGTGLVNKTIIDVLSNNIIAGKDVLQRIESGIVYKQTIVSHGNE